MTHRVPLILTEYFMAWTQCQHILITGGLRETSVYPVCMAPEYSLGTEYRNAYHQSTLPPTIQLHLQVARASYNPILWMDV